MPLDQLLQRYAELLLHGAWPVDVPAYAEKFGACMQEGQKFSSFMRYGSIFRVLESDDPHRDCFSCQKS